MSSAYMKGTKTQANWDDGSHHCSSIWWELEDAYIIAGQTDKILAVDNHLHVISFLCCRRWLVLYGMGFGWYYTPMRSKSTLYATIDSIRLPLGDRVTWVLWWRDIWWMCVGQRTEKWHNCGTVWDIDSAKYTICMELNDVRRIQIMNNIMAGGAPWCCS